MNTTPATAPIHATADKPDELFVFTLVTRTGPVDVFLWDQTKEGALKRFRQMRNTGR